jgi:hypothetical protein
MEEKSIKLKKLIADIFWFVGFAMLIAGVFTDSYILVWGAIGLILSGIFMALMAVLKILLRTKKR